MCVYMCVYYVMYTYVHMCISHLCSLSHPQPSPPPHPPHPPGVFGNQAQDTGIPVDVWRYYLLASRPERTDAEFNWDDFRLKFTADLNDNLGNFLMRVFKFIQDGCVVWGVW